MTVDDKLKKQGAEIAKSLGVNTLYVNTKGEFFTNKSLCAHSVGQKTEDYVELSYTIVGTPAATPNPYADLNATDLKTELDTRGIAYEAKANKATLTGLLTADDAAKADAQPAA